MAIETNLNAAKKTYGSFLGVVKWGSVAVAIVAIAVIFLITR
jgi:hypothetical protein